MTDMITEQQVLSFLQKNSGFLEKYADRLSLNVKPDNIVDFQSVLVEKLRNRIADETAEKEAVMYLGQNNFDTFIRMQHCILSALASENMMQLLDVVYTDWANVLGVDIVVLGVETDMKDTLPLKGMTFLGQGAVGRWLEGRDVHVQPKGTLEPVFGGASDLVNSYALVYLPLGQGKPDALMAFGCRDENTFANEEGTESIVFLCQALGYIVRRWLSLT